ncbi:hypothetical protein TWF694_010017 [Orbilia ellipsospora]|uniref:C2H2-type domain-containing protein n=1 Tax=Orbilia ellipsospora TaxID=2528407 RepID=A0AAV9XBR2_9PEZI
MSRDAVPKEGDYDPGSKEPEPETSISELTTRCCLAFQELLSKSLSDDLEWIETQLGRLNIWANNIGVFAVENASLDHRLRKSRDIKLLIIRLLKTLIQNLELAIDSNSHRYKVDQKGLVNLGAKTRQQDDGSWHLLNEAIEFASASIDRLQTIAVTIRKSSTQSRNTRAAASSNEDDENFEAFALSIIKHRFKEANGSLCEQLAAWLSLRRRHFIYISKHQTKLARNPFTESKKFEVEYSSPRSKLSDLNPEKINSEQAKTKKPNMPKDIPSKPALDAPSRTNASTVNTKAFREHIRRNKSAPSIISTGTFIPDAGLEYPPPPTFGQRERECTCPYCCELLPTAKVKNDRWWRHHVDMDVQAFACISEKCRDSPTQFAKYEEWVQHMSQHGPADAAWDVHLIIWRCPICDSDKLFRWKEEFMGHMKSSHSKRYTQSQLLTFARRGFVAALRDPYTCVFCNCIPKEIQDITPLNRGKFADLLPRHIANHLKSLAFMSLPYRDDIEDDCSQISKDPSHGLLSSQESVARESAVDEELANLSLVFEDEGPNLLADVPWSTEIDESIAEMHPFNINAEMTGILPTQADWSGPQTSCETNSDMAFSHSGHSTWALLIGIDCYIPGNKRKARYRNLNGCVTGVKAVQEYLDFLGVPNIAILTSSTCTNSASELPVEGIHALPVLSNIKRELTYIINNASPGDLVYIYYSGYVVRRETIGAQSGQRYSGDKINGIALALADIMAGGDYFTGYQLGVYVQYMVEEKDLRVTLVLDSCFSDREGRASYGLAYVAYQTAEGGLADNILQCDIDLDNRRAKMEQTIGKPAQQRNAIAKAACLVNPTGHTILTARDFSESARKENQPDTNTTHGAFTLHMLAKLKQNLASHRPTHASIRDYVHDELIRGRCKQSCHVIWQEGQMVDLDIGFAQGVVHGATYSVYRENQTPNSEATAPFTAYIVEIEEDEPFRCRAWLFDNKTHKLTTEDVTGGIAVLDNWAVPNTVIELSLAAQRALASVEVLVSAIQAELDTSGITLSSDAKSATQTPSFLLDVNSDNRFQIYITGVYGKPRQRIDRISNISVSDPNWIADLANLLQHITRYHFVKEHKTHYPTTIPESCLEVTVKTRKNGFWQHIKKIDGRYETTHGAVIKYCFKLSRSFIRDPDSEGIYASFYMFEGTKAIKKLRPALGQSALLMTETNGEVFRLEMEIPPASCNEDTNYVDDIVRVFLCTKNRSWEDIMLPPLHARAVGAPLAVSEKFIDPKVTAYGAGLGSTRNCCKTINGGDKELWGYVDIVVRTTPLVQSHGHIDAF